MVSSTLTPLTDRLTTTASDTLFEVESASTIVISSPFRSVVSSVVVSEAVLPGA